MTFARGARRRVARGSADARELDTLAHWLDSRFSVFGIRFGLDSILGIVPGIGDLAGLALSSTILVQGWRLGARKRTLARMAANVAGDTLVGSIPVVGTIVDVMWKANRSNMRLLRRDLERQAARS
ncbi:MAG: DUF4112 domain-containing protein [Pseudomonadota bacterium]